MSKSSKSKRPASHRRRVTAWCAVPLLVPTMCLAGCAWRTGGSPAIEQNAGPSVATGPGLDTSRDEVSGGSSVDHSTSPGALAEQPVVIIWRKTNGGGCAEEHTVVPQLVIYGDGRVLRADAGSLGQYCVPVPIFRQGRVDLASVRTRVERYLSTPASAVDMSRSRWSADAGLTVLEYTAMDGARRMIAADAIDLVVQGMPEEQLTGRAELAATIAAIDELTPASSEWTPTRVSVVKPANSVTWESADGAPIWPVRVPTEVRQMLDSSEGGCAIVTGPTAKRLLAAARARPTTAAMWTVDDRQQFLAIGVVLDGLSPCS